MQPTMKEEMGASSSNVETYPFVGGSEEHCPEKEQMERFVFGLLIF